MRLPRRFNNNHLHEVSDILLLCDPAGNMFEVVLEKLLGEAFFVQGWNAVGKFYGLHFRGWVRLVYVRCDRMLIKL